MSEVEKAIKKNSPIILLVMFVLTDLITTGYIIEYLQIPIKPALPIDTAILYKYSITALSRLMLAKSIILYSLFGFAIVKISGWKDEG